jgi:hypothetical protein
MWRKLQDTDRTEREMLVDDLDGAVNDLTTIVMERRRGLTSREVGRFIELVYGLDDLKVEVARTLEWMKE